MWQVSLRASLCFRNISPSFLSLYPLMVSGQASQESPSQLTHTIDRTLLRLALHFRCGVKSPEPSHLFPSGRHFKGSSGRPHLTKTLLASFQPSPRTSPRMLSTVVDRKGPYLRLRYNLTTSITQGSRGCLEGTKVWVGMVWNDV